MPNERSFDKPLFVVRGGDLVEDNIKEFFEWRRRTDPAAYEAAIRGLAEIIADVTVRQLLAQKAEEARVRTDARSGPVLRTSSGVGADQRPRIVPLADIDAIRAAGVLYPATVAGWRWLYRQRATRGMTHVFLRVGRRIMVDLAAYEAILREQPKERTREK